MRLYEVLSENMKIFKKSKNYKEKNMLIESEVAHINITEINFRSHINCATISIN